ncbi:MAG: hypothetical protein IT437_10855 [Phycisphaerales bacterium]|nr:hypothetical protein [Phycisphaerales bacterium]
MASRVLASLGACGAFCASVSAQCAPQWTRLGTGLSQEARAIVRGPLAGAPGAPGGIYVAGAFWAAGGQSAYRVASWDGGAWGSMQGGGAWQDATPRAAILLSSRSGGVDPGWYVGGTWHGGNIRVWDGTSWTDVGAGLTSTTVYSFVDALSMYDEDADGPGEPYLYAGGRFTLAGGLPCNGFARWDGSKWWPPPKQPEQFGTGVWPNMSDFGCFSTKFALQDPYADCNQDGARNLSDFGCFQTKFALGCP